MVLALAFRVVLDIILLLEGPYFKKLVYTDSKNWDLVIFLLCFFEEILPYSAFIVSIIVHLVKQNVNEQE